MTNQGPISGACKEPTDNEQQQHQIDSSIFVEPSHCIVCESEHQVADRIAAGGQNTTMVMNDDHHTSSTVTSTNSTKVCLKQQPNYSPTMNSGDSTRLQSILLISTLLIATSTTLSSSSIYNRGSYLQVAAAEPLEDPVPLSDHHHHHHNQQQQQQQQQQHHHQRQQQQRQLGGAGIRSTEQGEEKLSDSNSEQQQWTNIRQSAAAAAASSDKVNGISITSSFILDEDDSANNRDNDHDHDGGLGVELSTPRTKRSSLKATADERRPFVDCKRLANFWEYLMNSYPALSDYLLSLALGHLDASAGGKSTVSQELGQTVKLIGRLLSEADQLAREKQIVQIKTTLLEQPPLNPAAATGGNLQQHPALANGNGRAWLTRVAANPAYARIVKQYLLQQLHHQSRPPPGLAAQHRLASPTTITTTTTESSGGTGAAEISYGRVANYPHELDQSSSSVSRTIDKLHSLNNNRHQKQQQQQQQHYKQDSQLINDIQPELPQSALVASYPAEVESNQIPLIESEPDSKSSTTNKHQQPNYVYGNVLLRPSQARAAGGLGSVDNGAQPIDKLRKYNRLHNSGNHQQVSQSSSSLDKSIEQSNAAATATATAYGRVVISPAAARHNQREEQQLFVSTLEQQQSQGLGGASSSLNKLRDQLKPSQLGFGGTGNDQQQQASLGGSDDDEMATQQHASSMAASESGGDNPQTADGFEGIFHSGPIEHVEASRQVRRHSSPQMAYGSGEEANGSGSSSSSSDQVRVTTSSPGEILVID